MRILGYFSKPKGVREEKRLKNTSLEANAGNSKCAAITVMRNRIVLFETVAKLKYLRKKVKQVKFLLYPKEELINFEDDVQVSPSAS
jgi:hypothetical protein